jgi:hypothetical protein
VACPLLPDFYVNFFKEAAMTVKESLLAAAVSGLMMGSAFGYDKDSPKKKPLPKPNPLTDDYVAIPTADRPMGNNEHEEYCFGINKCKAYTFCGITPKDIAAANKSFSNKYKNSTPHNCSKQGKCAAVKGILGFTYVKKGTCLKVHKGFKIILDDKGGASIEK